MSQHGCPERLSNRSKGFPDESAGQATMEVLVETLTGTAFEMTVSPSDTIFAIKSKIFRVEGIPVSQQHLVYNLKELEDAASLRALGISDGARLRLVLGMRGGPISTRRLPPPPTEPWRDIERLLDSNRDEAWSHSGAGCKVTVLVFRDGERVNMLRVRENRDGSIQHRDHDYASPLCHSTEPTARDTATGGARDNAVTMNKMMELRRRMETLSVRRRADSKAEIQKTRSEETLSVPSLLDDGAYRACTPALYDDFRDGRLFDDCRDGRLFDDCRDGRLFDDCPRDVRLYEDCPREGRLYEDCPRDGRYTRLDLDCAFDRYTLLPPIGSRTDSDQSVDRIQEVDSERLMSDALAGSILVKRRDREEEAILEECLEGVESLRDSPQLAAGDLAPIPAAEYGPLVGGGWRARPFGSHGQLAPPPLPLPPLAPLGAAAHSASSLQLQPHPPLEDALFSSSTSDLETLTRNRMLPLSRHRNREHLHLSDEGLDVSHRPRNLEVGSERRQRRIKKIAELENSRLFRFGDSFEDVVQEVEKEPEKKEIKKIARIRCGFCKKRLSIATVHKCRCGAEFCAPHRYAEVHGCLYDYKANAHQYLQRANPLVSAPKLPKI
ncbi:uncharacterized protein LOC134797415 [Cydia splendana]|uniref:uncharacterized protein LOC134797415 n=1 Tax=Cydia splendana TaxID=1100963 RepID=UPI002145F772